MFGKAIMVAPDGTLTEGSHTSLFGVREGCILTAPLGQNILPGITRGLLTELAARAGIPLAAHEEREFEGRYAPKPGPHRHARP